MGPKKNIKKSKEGGGKKNPPVHPNRGLRICDNCELRKKDPYTLQCHNKSCKFYKEHQKAPARRSLPVFRTQNMFLILLLIILLSLIFWYFNLVSFPGAYGLKLSGDKMAGGAGSGAVPPVGEGGPIPELYLGYMKQILIPYLVAEQCFERFFVNFDFLHQECFKYTLSKGLGIGIIAGSLMVKVPQIMKILGAKSAAGITIISVLLELFAITSNMSYSFVSGYPFSAWGEACFLAIQTAIVAMLVLWYNNGSAILALSFLVAYVASVYGLVSGLNPIDTLRSMQTATIPVIVVSKLIQAASNYQNQSTGQLSAITIFMLTGGSIARIFTSIQETGDQTIILTYLAATAVNALIAFQMLWYWNSPANKKGKSSGKSAGKSGKPKPGGTKGPSGKPGSSAGPSPKKGGKKAKKDN